MAKSKREQPGECSDEVWEGLSTADQARAPITETGLWEQWAEMRHAIGLIDDLVSQVSKADGKAITKLTVMHKDTKDMQCLVILDADEKTKSYASFYQGFTAFRAMVSALHRAVIGSGDWRERQPRSAQAAAEADAGPFQSGAF